MKRATTPQIIFLVILLSACLVGCAQKTPEPQFTEQQAYSLAKKYVFNSFPRIEIVEDSIMGYDSLDLPDSYYFFINFRFVPDIGRMMVFVKVDKQTEEVSLRNWIEDVKLEGGKSLRNMAFQVLRDNKITKLVDEGILQKLDIVNLCHICSEVYSRLADDALQQADFDKSDEYDTESGWWQYQGERIIDSQVDSHVTIPQVNKAAIKAHNFAA